MIRYTINYILLLLVIITGANRAYSQSAIPEVLNNGTLNEQMNYLEERTRIYENYRAIREDMFQLIKRNSLDSLSQVHRQLNMLAGMNRNMVEKLDSVTMSLEKTKVNLDNALNSKNSIKVIGIEVNKILYNSIMWIITGTLLLLLATGFLTLKKNIITTRNTKKELNDLRDEFEAYRQKARIEREKMSMDHFNEIKRLKGK